MNIALIGPSGVGKGTHAASLCTRFDLRHVATGDLFRYHLQTHSAIGQLARKYMEQGELVPDEVVDSIIEEWCVQRTPGEGALFDGFPRTAYQAQFLDRLLQKLNRPLDAVVYLRVPDDVIVSRLAGRLICRNCQAPYHRTLHPAQRDGFCDVCGHELYQRPDDTTQLVQARVRIFHRMTGPVLEHYAAAGRLALINGEGTIREVEARLLDLVAAMQQGSARFATREETAQIVAVESAALSAAQLARVSPEPGAARRSRLGQGHAGRGVVRRAPAATHRHRRPVPRKSPTSHRPRQTGSDLYGSRRARAR